MTKHLLIIAHTPSINTRALADAALRGASTDDAGEVTAQAMSPFDVVADDLLATDGVILGTTENIGYMAGATKDMFDRCYNTWLGRTEACLYSIFVPALTVPRPDGHWKASSAPRGGALSPRH